MNPSWWGGHTWEALHYITLGYPEHSPSPKTRQAARDMLLSLQHLLPCSLCRQHLQDILSTHLPLTDAVLASRRAFGEYIVALRDHVKRAHVLPRGTAWQTHNFDDDVVDRLYTRKKACPRFPSLVVVVTLFAAAVFLTYTTTSRANR